MLNIIDPSAEIKDLLKEKHGRHIATRPPREVINLLGIFRHKV